MWNNLHGAAGDRLDVVSHGQIAIDGRRDKSAEMGLSFWGDHQHRSDWFASLKLPSNVSVQQLLESPGYTYGVFISGGANSRMMVFTIDKITPKPSCWMTWSTWTATEDCIGAVSSPAARPRASVLQPHAAAEERGGLLAS